MGRSKAFLTRHSLVLGIVLMFLLTWPIDLANAGVTPFRVPFAVAILVGYGIVAASLVMTGLTQGKSGVLALLKRFLRWRVGWKWFVAALFLLPGIDLVAVYLNAALARAPVDFGSAIAHKIFGPGANLLVVVVPYLLFDAITNGEEIGWRGYVLPRLQAKHTALTSALVVGVVWTVWHIPKFVTHWDPGVFALFAVDILAKSVLYTWVYNGTGGSLLLVTLLHAASNAAGVVLPGLATTASTDVRTLVIVCALEVVVALVVTLVEGPARLSRTKPMQQTCAIDEGEPVEMRGAT